MNLLVEHTFGGLVKDSFAVYFKNFVSIFLLYFIPVFPLATWNTYASFVEEPVQMGISTILMLMVTVFLAAAMTVAVSDICLGNKPSVKRSYLAVFGPVLGKFVWTYFLFLLVLIVGLILLVIPAFFFAVFYMFALTIVILEGSSGKEALARSKELGKGFYLRNFLVILVIGLSVGLINWLLAFVLAIPLVQFIEQPLVLSAIFAAIELLITPVQLIVTIVLYYDLRVRKEAYDSTSLTQDLQR